MFAHNPLHGSGRAGFPHPALALGDDAHAAQGIGMTDGRHRKPASDEAPHAIPKDAAFLAAPRKRAMPEPPHLKPKDPQRVVVLGHSVIPDVSTHHRLQPLAYFGDGFMHPSLKFGFHLVQFSLQTSRKRLQTKLNEVKAELQRRMHEPIPEVGKWLQAVVRGHIRYYGVPMNQPALYLFRFQVGRLWHRALSRRSQKGRVLWDRMRRLITRWLPLPSVCHPYPLRRIGVLT